MTAPRPKGNRVPRAAQPPPPPPYVEPYEPKPDLSRRFIVYSVLIVAVIVFGVIAVVSSNNRERNDNQQYEKTWCQTYGNC